MKKNKVYSPVELDFESGECSETFESKLSSVCNRVRSLRNPYVGNKSKILYYIIKTIKDEGIEYDSVLDLFSGSAYMSLAMKLMGKRVVSNDIMSSSCIYAKAFVENNDTALTDEDKKYLLENENGALDQFSFGDHEDKFEHDEILFLKRYRTNAMSLRHYYSLTEEFFMKEAIAIACMQLYIMERVFVGGRLYNGQILARLDHRIDHPRNHGKSMNFNNIKWYDFRIPDDKNKHLALNLDVMELLDPASSNYNQVKKCELAYIDPPYGGEQSDYFKMYDFFNMYYLMGASSLSKGDKKRFSNSKSYEENFTELLSLLNDADIPYWILSYNDSSWAGIDKIKEIISTFKNNVKVYDLDYSYKYRDSKSSSGTEYLIVAKP